MYLAYFIVSACDLLDIIRTSTSPSERQEWIDWIYRCQHSKGGFRMWPGTDFGERANAENAKWDPANVPATYFALASLLILGDDLKRVQRMETLRWIHAMQREDGSFGETLVDGKREGGRDPRLGYCATGVRYILRGGTEPGPLTIDGEVVEDIDFDTYVNCIRRSENFDGGIADAPFHEPQAGYTFCSLGSLSFLSRLETGNPTQARENHGPSNPHDVVRWLLSLQTKFIDPDDPPTGDLEFEPSEDNLTTKEKNTQTPPSDLHQSPEKSTLWASDISTSPHNTTTNTNTNIPTLPTPHLAICPSHPSPNPTGMSGRPSKPADTCYAFWAVASLNLLSPATKETAPLHTPAALRGYLLTLTQHPIMGGFSKFPGDKWADLYHSYLGLAALSLCSSAEERERDGVKEVDAGMCVSVEVRGRLEGLWQGWEE
ncbi:hypothetical protein Q7P37_003003 [Cladosporium fusiforme]